MAPPGTQAMQVVIPGSVQLSGEREGVAALTVVTNGAVVCIDVVGSVVGRGGRGGSGGNGGTGGGVGPSPRFCARDGEAGGPAIWVDGPAHVVVSGLLAGGGGGGAGYSACNLVGGGGGGAGRPAGEGGAAATSLSAAEELAFCGQDNGYRTGPAGLPGTLRTGGAGGLNPSGDQAGNGGDLGVTGRRATGPCGSISLGEPGPAGHAVFGPPGALRTVQRVGMGEVFGAVQ